VVQGAGANAYQNLIGLNFRIGRVFIDKRFGSSVLVDAGELQGKFYLTTVTVTSSFRSGNSFVVITTSLAFSFFLTINCASMVRACSP
jgi:hypothetical protein